MNYKTKTFANTWIYGKLDYNGYSADYALIKFMQEKESRINKNSEAFSQIRNDVKTRQSSAILYRILMMPDVYLVISEKELPSSFKVFRAKDVLSSSKKPATFIDCTGLIKYENGYYSCKNIHVLTSYLFGALIMKMYYEKTSSLLTNVNILKDATLCFVKLFTGILDNLRVNNYSDHRLKISYISGVYFLYNVVGKDIKTAQTISATAIGINTKDAAGFDFWYDALKDFENIDTFIKFLTETFKLKGLTTDAVLLKWHNIYGKGTHYGTELFPAFLNIIAYAYVGQYINGQKAIENMCGRAMATLATNIIKAGYSAFDTGFEYESAVERRDWEYSKKNRDRI